MPRVETAVGLVALAFAAVPALAEAERFRLVGAETAPALERRLEAAAAEGYRLRHAARGAGIGGKDRAVALLEHDPSARDVGYAVVATTGALENGSSPGRLASLAAAGYRARAEGVLAGDADPWWSGARDREQGVWLILERDGDPAAREYATLAFETEARFRREMAGRLAEGFTAVALMNNGRRLQVLLERDASSAPDDAPPPLPGDRYRMLIGSRKLGVRLQLNDAAQQGYRLLAAADASTRAPPMMLVEKSAAGIGRHRYRTLYEPGVKIYKDKLERKLNKRASRELRIAPGGITSEVVVFEETDTPMEYRTLSSRSRTPLVELLAGAAGQGFEVVALFVNGDETTVVVERGR